MGWPMTVPPIERCSFRTTFVGLRFADPEPFAGCPVSATAQKLFIFGQFPCSFYRLNARQTGILALVRGLCMFQCPDWQKKATAWEIHF
jgi:hypothetical protein